MACLVTSKSTRLMKLGGSGLFYDLELHMNYRVLFAAPMAAYLATVSASTLTPPKGWSATVQSAQEPGQRIQVGMDPDLRFQDQPVLSIKSAPDVKSSEYGAIWQSARNYAGSKVRLSGYLRGSDLQAWGGVFLHSETGRVGLFKTSSAADAAMVSEGMFPQLIGLDKNELLPLGVKAGKDWQAFSIVLQVPADRAELKLGLLLSGGGQVWVSGLKFEQVDASVAETSERMALDMGGLHQVAIGRTRLLPSSPTAPQPPSLTIAP